MIEYTYEPPQAPLTEAIMYQGQKYGEIWKTHAGYQCQLIFGPLREGFSCLTMNGTGTAKEECILNAVINGETDAGRIIRACNEMRGIIGGE
ncbi:MAG: hypothetical protein RBT40_13000 [Petrimonas sp.]|jgi:hypothetical protein|nr:hypothetical protein [Petrimonas sp.]